MSIEGFGAIAALGYEIGIKPHVEEKRRLRANREAYLAEAREAKRNSLEQRMKDARRAGLHPLVALGAHQPTSSQWVSGNTDAPDISSHLYRAASSISTPEEKNFNKLALRSAQLDVQGKELDNMYKASLIRRADAPGDAPTPSWNESPMPGQDSSRVQMKPSEIIASQTGSPAGEAGAVTDYGYTKTDDGGLALVPSLDAKARIEDQFVPETQWALRNFHWNPPRYPGREYDRLLPKGARGWEWNPIFQKWEPRFKVAPWEKLGKDYPRR